MSAVYWMTPVVCENPLTLGRERISLPDSNGTESFRRKLAYIHPRMPMMFKAHLLLSEDDGACGVDNMPFGLAGGDDIRFDGAPFALSHCAEAYMLRLPAVSELRERMALAAAAIEWTAAEQELLACVNGWLERDWPILFIKEQ